MFFKALGHFVSRFWAGIILFWIVLVAACALFVPDLGEVARDDRSKFLPSSSDSVLAKNLLDRFFPKESFESRIVVVIEKPAPVTEADLEWLDLKVNAFAEKAPYENIRKIVTPINSKLFRNKLVSRDGRAAMAVLFLSTHYVAVESQATVEKILGEIEPPADSTLSVNATGDAVVGYDYHLAIRDSIDRTTWATILLLCVILIFIFRSPVTPVIPLLTIGISFFIAKGAAALISLAGYAVSPLTEILLIVVLFGAGTDYCVFLVFRYGEEISRGENPQLAVKTTLNTVGAAISCSAMTVIIGIGCLLFALFGPFRQTGPYIALGVAITLAAGLTLTPSLILAFQRFLFWPSGVVRYDLLPTMTKWVTRLVIQRPFQVALLIVVILFPLLVLGAKADRSFDLLRELPESFHSRQGMGILKRHFSRGEMSPLVLVLDSDTLLNTPAGLDRIYQLTRALARRREVQEVRSAVWPTGDPKLLEKGLLKNQVKQIKEGLSELREGAQKIQEGLDEIRARLEKRQKGLGGANLMAGLFAGGARGQLAELKSALARLSEGTGRLNEGLQKIHSTMDTWTEPGSAALPALDHLALPPDILEREPRLEEALDHYISAEGYGSRLTLVLRATPYSKQEKEDLLALKTFMRGEIRQIFPSKVRFHFAGSGSTILDQRLVTQQDFLRVLFFVLGGVFLVLLLLLGKSWAPLYLIATMIFNYYVSLGLTSFIFERVQGLDGLDWKVPFFMFVLLVALGEDYNIFLMSRIEEERRRNNLQEAVRLTLIRTGPLIGICGIILAGTFLTLVLSPLEALVQMGVGIAAGVLMATFVVVPLLVPAIALLVGRFTK